jgi:16S rRNA (guanine527-N7)-methyltransferase
VTEDEAQAWLAGQGISEAAMARLALLAELVVAENTHQNLISASTIPQIWARHIVDSAQLLGHVSVMAEDRPWVDMGSGAGFPGLVVACLRENPIILVETRALRVRFLERCIDVLKLSHAHVKQQKVERLELDTPAAVVSARAFASLDRTFAMASHFCDENTLWLLPKGRNAEIELATARKEWQAVFHVEQSVTDADSAIIVATGVGRRHGGSGAAQSPRRHKA